AASPRETSRRPAAARAGRAAEAQARRSVVVIVVVIIVVIVVVIIVVIVVVIIVVVVIVVVLVVALELAVVPFAHARGPGALPGARGRGVRGRGALVPRGAARARLLAGGRRLAGRLRRGLGLHGAHAGIGVDAARGLLGGLRRGQRDGAVGNAHRLRSRGGAVCRRAHRDAGPGARGVLPRG